MQQGCAPPDGVGKPPHPFVNSFLNLCRVCPMPTDDKVNSEYKRNFTWHDGYQATKVDVVRNAPSVPSSEPPLPRKKHYPVQQHHSLHLLYDEGGESSDSLEVGLSSLETDSRARSEERNNAKSRASPRSRSADSTISRRLRVTSIPDEDLKVPARAADDASKKPEEKQPLMSQSYPPSGGAQEPESTTSSGIPKTTEYRSQFVAWPRPPGESCGATARKSASMGLIAANKKQDAVDGEAPCVDQRNVTPDDDDDDAALDAVKRGRIKKTEYKAKFRPFSAYTYVDGSWKKATRLIKDGEPVNESDRHAWYLEVVERLKKADQYRVRSHVGTSETPEGLTGRAVLSPVSLIASSPRTWKDSGKERGRPPVSIHHKKKDTDVADYPKSREGSMKKKSQVEKTTVRPKSAEPVIPVAKSEHKSPKRTRPRAPKDLPVHGHGDLSGRKKAYKQSAEKSSPIGGKPRAVPRPREDGGKVWLKPDAKEDKEGGEESAPKEEALVNGFGSEEHSEEHSVQPGMTGDDQPQINGEHVVPVTKPPMKVPLTTVKSPEEVTGVRSPDPESWTVPLEIGKGLHWMDGKTPDGAPAKGPPTLLSKRLKESSLVGKSQKDIVVCDPGSENTGESVDL